jgi:hypothetical protein
MSKDFSLGVRDFSGGLNQAPHGSTIAPNEVSDILNFFPFAGKIISRPARVPLFSAAPNQITGLMAFKTNAGTWALIALHTTGAARWSGAWVSISSSLGSLTDPWRTRQYVNTGYAARRNTGNLKRFTLNLMEDAGLAAPLAAPVLAQGGGGNLTAGTYYGVYTTYNPDTQVESNPSPLSLPVTIAANTAIDWTSLLVGLEGQVGARRLYRTALNQRAPLFRVATLLDNTSTSYLGENVLTADFGPAASYRNGIPPQNIELLEIFAERLWVSDGDAVYPSELGNVESFYGLNKIQVSPDDGHKITGLLNWPIGEQSRLAIAKTNSMWYIKGTDIATFELKSLSQKYGCISQESMQVAEGVLIWFEGSNFFISEGGAAPRSISDTKVRTLLDSLPAAYKSAAVSAIYPRYGWYLCSLQTASNGARTMLVYSYRTNAWSVFEYTPDLGVAPSVMADFYDSNGERQLYAAFSGSRVYDIAPADVYLDDWVDEITRRLRTGDMSDGGKELFLRRVSILSNKNVGQLSLAAFINGLRDTTISNGSSYRSALSMYLDTEWKAYNLSTFKRHVTSIAVQLEHTSGDYVEISGITMDGVQSETYRQAQ